MVQSKHTRRILCIAAAAVLAHGATAHATAYTWVSTAGGNWNTSGGGVGWDAAGAYPHLAGDSATVNTNITGTSNIVVNVADATVGSLFIGDSAVSPTNYSNFGITPNSGNTLKIDNNGSNATITSVNGNNTITAGVVLNSTLETTASSGSFNISGLISGNGGIIHKVGNFSLTNTTNNTYLGGTRIEGGILTFNSGALSNTGNIVFVGGSLKWNTANTQDVSGRIKNSTSPISIQTNNNDVTFASSIDSSNSGGLSKETAGTLKLDAAMGYTGDTVLNGGSLGLGTNGSVVGNFKFTGGIYKYLDGNTVDISSKIKNSTSSISIDTNGNDVTFGSVLDTSNSVGLNKMGAGKLTLTADNTNTGVTRIQGGTVEVATILNGGQTSKFGAGGATASALIMSGGGGIRYVGSGNTTNRSFQLGTGGAFLDSSGSGPLVLNGATAIAFVNGTTTTTLTLTGDNTNDNTFGLSLPDNSVNAVSVVKSGTGTWLIGKSSGQSYTGATDINGGTLRVISNLGNTPVAVNNTGTLAGTGNIAGTVTVNSGGTLSPGNSPGTLNVGGLTLTDGGEYNWQVADASGTAGSGYDSVNTTGTLDLASLGNGGFDINLWSLSAVGPDANGDALNFDGNGTYTWTLVSTNNAILNYSASKFDVIVGASNGTSGFSNTAPGTFSTALSNDGTDLLLTYSVPEPTSLTVLAGVGLLMGRRRSRRR